MLRPDVFRHACVPVRNLPYKALEAHTIIPDHDGVLSTWQIVWTEQACGAHPASDKFIAYVDGIGEVSIDPQCLAPLNLSRDQEEALETRH